MNRWVHLKPPQLNRSYSWKCLKVRSCNYWSRRLRIRSLRAKRRVHSKWRREGRWSQKRSKNKIQIPYLPKWPGWVPAHLEWVWGKRLVRNWVRMINPQPPPRGQLHSTQGARALSWALRPQRKLAKHPWNRGLRTFHGHRCRNSGGEMDHPRGLKTWSES